MTAGDTYAVDALSEVANAGGCLSETEASAVLVAAEVVQHLGTLFHQVVDIELILDSGQHIRVERLINEVLGRTSSKKDSALRRKSSMLSTGCFGSERVTAWWASRGQLTSTAVARASLQLSTTPAAGRQVTVAAAQATRTEMEDVSFIVSSAPEWQRWNECK